MHCFSTWLNSLLISFSNQVISGSAFLSFMACAYSPAYIEDYMQYIKEKRNGLYGATSMIVSNFIIGTPYLCELNLDQGVDIASWCKLTLTLQSSSLWCFHQFLIGSLTSSQRLRPSLFRSYGCSSTSSEPKVWSFLCHRCFHPLLSHLH